MHTEQNSSPSKRKPFKLVASVFQPLPDAEEAPERIPTIPLRNISVEVANSSPHLQLEEASNHPNIAYICSLLPAHFRSRTTLLAKGTSMRTNSEDRWLVLKGSISVIGRNESAYRMGAGYFFFVNPETQKKTKQVNALEDSKLLNIPQRFYEESLRDYILIKNAERIKFLRQCPFFIWKDELSEDLAACMTTQEQTDGEIIFEAGSVPGALYFVKQGVVALERDYCPAQKIFKDYESHYQTNQRGENEAVVIVRKGMVFGMDGILIRDIQPDTREPKRSRVYTARAVGRCEFYRLEREPLETLFHLQDVESKVNSQTVYANSTNNLNIVASDYARFASGAQVLPKIMSTKAIKQAELNLNGLEDKDLQNKQQQVKKIRDFDKKIGRLSVASIISDVKNTKRKSLTPVPIRSYEETVEAIKRSPSKPKIPPLFRMSEGASLVKAKSHSVRLEAARRQSFPESSPSKGGALFSGFKFVNVIGYKSVFPCFWEKFITDGSQPA